MTKRIKEAVAAGDEYHDFQYLLQFYQSISSELESRIKKLELVVDNFISEGGKIERDEKENSDTVSLTTEAGFTLQDTIVYKDNGEVDWYCATACKDKELLNKMHRILWTAKTLPYYKGCRYIIEKMLKDAKNSVTVNSLARLSKQINGDTSWLVPVLSGFNINDIKGSVDPFDVFTEDK
jgi:hypothetical protein